MTKQEIENRMAEHLSSEESLKKEMIEWIRRNCSLRYANKKLGLDSAYTSRVLNGKQKISLKRLMEMVSDIEGIKRKSENFVTSVEYSSIG
jgi:hypothetical protein